MAYKTPGVYVKEISTLPPSVAQVETAIPAFIGYTEIATDENGNAIADDNALYIDRIKSYPEYVERFGNAPLAPFSVSISAADEIAAIADPGLTFRMNYALQMYFANGGGPCYICSVKRYGNTPPAIALTDFYDASNPDGLDTVAKEDEPTILVFPDMPGLSNNAAADTVAQQALVQCADLGDRVALLDVYTNDAAASFSSVESTFRTGVGNNNLKYGMAYYPYLQTSINYYFEEDQLDITTVNFGVVKLKNDANEADSLFHLHNECYHNVKAELAKHYVVMPPSSAMAGVYAMVDRTRGVWKAPANVSLNRVQKAMVDIDNTDQDEMNVSTTGKSVNAIRAFFGKGILVWGARTLAGNDNEWRYVSVRRFYNMVEESVKKASIQFVFEPNDANTWVKVRAMIENFLVLQWRAGALAGAKPEEAFFVKVGLGETMTALDILEGRMNVEIGMAVVRPAEFIILKFSHKMQES